ncbi:hypothetical protein Zmor_000824 [Zophobas morio]|uniref:Odorant receptor n=1 Tax=Zophobas morio TaxID=2755281 RepID=A0AA38J776_9CUCU|nr:hypothetical protein Zmor_000824 [Zophobas morio]
MAPYVDLMEPLKGVISILKYMGVWESENIFYKLYRNVIPTFLVIMIASAIKFYSEISNYDEETVETLYVFIGCFEGMTKTLMCRKKFSMIVSSWKILEQNQLQPRNESQKKILNDYMRISKLIFKLYMGSFFVAGVVVPGVPILTGQKNLPIPQWYPFNYHRPVLFEIFYVYTYISVFSCAICNSGVDCMFYISMNQIAGQCDMLCDTIRNVDVLTDEDKIAKEDEMNKILVECVQQFTLIRRYAQLLADIYKESIMVQFGTSIGILCVAMFRLSQLQQLDLTFLSTFLFCYAATLEIFFYCYFGDLATEKSEKIFYAAFKSSWYNSGHVFNKNLFTFMQMVQQPIVIYSFNIFPVNYETFKKIMQKTWSFYLALQNFQDRQGSR